MKYCTQCGQPTTQKTDNLFICTNNHENWLNAPVAAVACILKDGKLLFGVRAIEPGIGKVALPGGFVDLNETLEQALVREGHEELGVEFEIIDYLGSYTSQYLKRQVLNVVYIVKSRSETFTPHDDLAGGDIMWREITDLPAESELTWTWQIPMFEDLKKWYQAHGNC